jgi:hypothetical protein
VAFKCGLMALAVLAWCDFFQWWPFSVAFVVLASCDGGTSGCFEGFGGVGIM